MIPAAVIAAAESAIFDCSTQTGREPQVLYANPVWLEEMGVVPSESGCMGFLFGLPIYTATYLSHGEMLWGFDDDYI